MFLGCALLLWYAVVCSAVLCCAAAMRRLRFGFFGLFFLLDDDGRKNLLPHLSLKRHVTLHNSCGSNFDAPRMFPPARTKSEPLHGWNMECGMRNVRFQRLHRRQHHDNRSKMHQRGKIRKPPPKTSTFPQSFGT